MSREQELIESMKKLLLSDMNKDLAKLKRKIREVEHARDDWKSQALGYRKQIIELRSNNGRTKQTHVSSLGSQQH